MKQQQRDRVMNGFRNGRTEILIATDVAARGIDVDNVDAVFNYDLPQDEEYYVHRIGRTGRAGKNGKAFTFVTGREFYKLKDIQRYCKTNIISKQVPSQNDVANVNADNIFEKVTKMIEEDNLKSYVRMIEEKLEKEEYTTLDLAAAFLKMALGDETSSADIDVDDFGDTGAEDGMVRLFINIGKNQKARPGDILGAIAGETGIAGNLIGTIDMYDKYTFVEVPKAHARAVLAAMSNARIKGRSINIEPANKK
jgi:ATP-dependent RNA helicase DeaD